MLVLILSARLVRPTNLVRHSDAAVQALATQPIMYNVSTESSHKIPLIEIAHGELVEVVYPTVL